VSSIVLVFWNIFPNAIKHRTGYAVIYVAMKLLISKFTLVVPLTAICSVQKITDANSNQAIDGGYEDLIKSGDHSEL